MGIKKNDINVFFLQFFSLLLFGFQHTTNLPLLLASFTTRNNFITSQRNHYEDLDTLHETRENQLTHQKQQSLQFYKIFTPGMTGLFLKNGWLFFLFLLVPFVKMHGELTDLDSFIINYTKRNTMTNNLCVYVKDIKKNKMLCTYDNFNMGNTELPLGSLIKIFSIIVKFKNHPIDPTETHFCGGYDENTPYVSRCWLKKGHGQMSLIPALAHSCNTFFYHFVQDIDFHLFIETLKEWGILKGSENWGKRFISKEEQIMAMIGKMNILKLKPIDIIESYGGIFSEKRKLQEDVKEILVEGMRLCYQNGTASKTREKLFLPVDVPIVCKTGTGVFEKDGKINMRKTSGSFIGLLEERYLVFVFVENSTGAEAPAAVGLSILKEIRKREMRPYLPSPT